MLHYTVVENSSSYELQAVLRSAQPGTVPRGASEKDRRGGEREEEEARGREGSLQTEAGARAASQDAAEGGTRQEAAGGKSQLHREDQEPAGLLSLRGKDTQGRRTEKEG